MVVTKYDFMKVLIATAAVFLIGLSLGFVLDTKRTSYLSGELREANLETESFIVGQMYLENVQDEDFCNLMDQRITNIAEDTTELGNDLQNFGESGMFRKGDYTFLQNKYYLYQIRFLMMLEDYQERCDENLVTLLYFFSDNIQSKRQGAALTNVRKENQGKVFVFSFNKDVPDTPVIDMVERDYSINSTPSLVINQEKVIRQFTSEQKLKRLVEQQLNRTTQQ
jgi:hypothetical protein